MQVDAASLDDAHDAPSQPDEYSWFRSRIMASSSILLLYLYLIFEKSKISLHRQPAPLTTYNRINIGDVGYVRSGRFHLLFSGRKGSCDRIRGHAQEVPANYEPIIVEDWQISEDQPRKPGSIKTALIKTTGGEGGLSLDM